MWMKWSCRIVEVRESIGTRGVTGTGRRLTRGCHRTCPNLRRLFGGQRGLGRGFESGEQGEWPVAARIGLGKGGSRQGAKGVRFLCPLL